MFKKILICFLLISILFSFTNVQSYAFNPLDDARNAYDSALSAVDKATTDLENALASGVSGTIDSAKTNLGKAKDFAGEKFENLKGFVQENKQEIVTGALVLGGSATGNIPLITNGIGVKNMTKDEFKELDKKVGDTVQSIVKPSNYNTDVIVLKISLAPALGFLRLLEKPVNEDIGKFDLDSMLSNRAYGAFVKLAGSIFLMLLAWELIWLIFGKVKFKEFIFNFFMAIIGTAKNIIIITILVTVSNLLIQSFTTVSFMEFMIGKVENFINISEANTGNWGQFIFKGVTDIPENTIKNLNPALGFFGSLVTERGQFYWTAVISSWAYVILALINWIPMIVVNLTLSVLVLLSPVLSVIGVNEFGRQLQTKYWALLWDCLIAKVAFHLVLWFLFSTVIVGDMNFVYLIKTIVSFLILPVIVIKIRTMFAFEYQPSENGNTTQTIRNSVTNVVSNSVKSVQGAAGGAAKFIK